MNIEQETIEAVDLELFKLEFKEFCGQRLTPFEQRARIKLISAMQRLKREKDYKEVLSQ